METDKALISKILGGNLNAFRDLIDTYQKLVVHVVFRMISRQEHREEICQEVFIKVFQNLARFKFESKLSTWIGKIAYTTTINHLRKEKIQGPNEIWNTQNNIRNDENHYEPLDTIRSDDLNPVEILEKQDISKIIQKKIEQLPGPYKTIFTLYHLEQMSYQEISEIMDLPEGTVKSYLFRGRKKLKESLVRELQGEEIL